MGYSTEYIGRLKFRKELVASQIAYLSEILGEDERYHPEWDTNLLNQQYYVNLEFLPDYSGLQWDGAEKTYHMDSIIELVVTLMRRRWSDFSLDGVLMAQGEVSHDRYKVVVDDGVPKIIKIDVKNKAIKCPNCEWEFDPEE